MAPASPGGAETLNNLHLTSARPALRRLFTLDYKKTSGMANPAE
jgi:hypothetical protein